MSLIKYPRTFHLPWSEGKSSDDKVLRSTDCFKGKHVVVTEKMDGENTSLYRDHIHARSLDSKHHPSRDWVKNFWQSIRYNIPEGWRVCGENMYATHSIHYTNLPSYFLGFSIWNGNICLSWEETLEWFDLLSIEHVPVLHQCEYHDIMLKHLWTTMDSEKSEGYIVRVCNDFTTEEFSKCVAKFVRSRHIQTDEHWSTQEIIPNELAHK